ncbi:arylsulfatase [Chitinophaga cymbidii]|uniref:Arylsulfatase n=1 Tax=Chitinophaga cymbidii TaxID=1096750 RepID=A0A512RRC9_9BACT|nr:arylsulfatase [Chitinophaga cymbidii]GEP98259.1 arylsulfatase [Chitinophaga cymbidii]
MNSGWKSFFYKHITLIAIFFLITVDVCHAAPRQLDKGNDERPNIIIILADDMGFSDIGCYGSEIPTPNIDQLAKDGVRFTQFYNNARCCPSRASLLTGLYPHESGIGRMAEDPEDPKANDEGVDGYRGYLTKNSVTIAEVLQPAGYHTYMTGKWHVGMHGREKWPLQRGFEKFYGILSGGSSYLKPFPPRGITADNGETQYDFPEGYYTTDAFADNAVGFIRQQHDDAPFFLYLAFTAPHWPLQAKPGDVEKFRDKYAMGWDSIRHERWRKQLAMGLVKPGWEVAGREMRPWNELSEQEQKDVAYRMSVYSAQIYCMDYNIGKLLDELKRSGKLDNTLIMFLSDNGACAEPYKELGGKPVEEVNNPRSFWFPSYGTGWANVSNVPYKKWKNTTYEGGTSTPLIVSWPKAMKKRKGKLVSSPYHIIDIMSTVVNAANTSYPSVYQGNSIIRTEGINMLPAILKGQGKTHDYFYWEHEENCAILHGNWKAVKKLPKGRWELYDLSNDRSERFDVAHNHQEIVDNLGAKWQKWADAHKVFPKGRIYYNRHK